MGKLLEIVGGDLSFYIKMVKKFGSIFDNGDFPLSLMDLDDIIFHLRKVTRKAEELEEVLVFANKETRESISSALSEISNWDQEDGVSYGVFDNSCGKATELGVTGFLRGGISFYVVPSNEIQNSVVVPYLEDQGLTEQIEKSIVIEL